MLAIVNFDGAQRQCYARLALSGPYQLKDQMNGSTQAIEGDVLHLELPEWGYRIFQVAPATAA